MPPLIKILHIDDDAVMRLMIKKSLERSTHGFEIMSCTSADEFMESLPKFLPDLLIIDVVMPILNGPTVLANVRKLQNRTPAIFVTGQENLELDNQENLEPIIGMIHKPFSPIALGDQLLAFWKKFHASSLSKA